MTSAYGVKRKESREELDHVCGQIRYSMTDSEVRKAYNKW